MRKKQAHIFAFAGKGGSGKTTLAGLLVRFLKEHRMTPILAVDADSNANFNEVLGLEVEDTLGQAREMLKKEVSVGMTKDVFIEMKVEQALVETKDFDLIVMGRPEGPGCYCAANNIIRKYTDQLSGAYPYVVIDNEAGMEHLSRRTTHRVNLLMIVSDPSARGLQTAKRIDALVGELGLDIVRRVLLINRISGDEEKELRNLAEREHLPVAGVVPHDDLLIRLGIRGGSVFHLPADSKSLRALYAILDTLKIT